MKKIIFLLLLSVFLFACTSSNCGDGVCDKINEGKILCPQDCDPDYSFCGDGKITGNENCENCAEDFNCSEGFECSGKECRKKSVIVEPECSIDSDCGNSFQCKSGKCIKVHDLCAEINCDDGNPCTLNECDLITGECVSSFVKDKTSCGSGKECYSGKCITVKYCSINSDCDDSIECTIDKCNSDTNKCSYTSNNSKCNDGIACTVDSCDVLNGCVYSLNDFACDDGIDCTANKCTLTGCVYDSNSSKCNDGIACTIDSCNIQAGCIHTLSDVKCDDKIDCTANKCTLTGCVFTPRNELCTNTDLCKTGTCTLNGCEFEVINCGQSDLFCESGNCVYLPCAKIAEELGEEVVLCEETDLCSGDWRPSYEGNNVCCKGECIAPK
ncbi:MAG: hypothetical protein JW703_03885 [Candidatus Diapherotrites archaeon]|nr:hypothetical protein [Candidatus Diapherotrites archaeon]